MKKKNYSVSFLIVVLIITSFSFISCEDKNGVENNILTLTPVISKITPGTGKSGDIITIKGDNFGTDKSKVKVKFNITESSNIISVTNNKIEVEVPVGLIEASLGITVQVNDEVSNRMSFFYMDQTASPSITSLTATCFYGSTVVINGINFSPNIEENIVKFGSVEAAVTEATNVSLTVIAPDLGSAATAEVTVTRFNKVSNNRSINIDLDQNKVATYNWTTHTVRPGVIYKTGQFTLFGSIARRIHVLDVTLDNTNVLGIGFSTSNKSTVDMCKDYDAVVGINAGYFPMSGTSDKDPYIRIDGTTIQDGHLGVNRIFTNSALLIHDNVAKIRKFTESGNRLNQVAAAIPVSEAQNIIVCGPMLITDGQLETQDMDNSHNSSSTARTGLGVTADGKRVFMVVVDYNDGATGIQTPQLAKILQALGAVNAMNFDGGGSATMFVQGQGDNGRVSFNTYPQRAVRSVIYVK